MTSWPQFDLRMVTMNMGTRGEKEPTEDTRPENVIRRERVAVYWKKVKPDIVFAQDIPTSPTSPDNWELDITKYVFLNEDNKVGIAYNSGVFEHTIRIDTNEKKKIAVEMPEDSPDIERLFAAVLLHKKTHLRLLCVSWHGRYNKESSTRTRTGRDEDDHKKLLLQKMLIFVQAMADYRKREGTYNHDAIVIGGDFNLEVHKVPKKNECGDFELLHASKIDKVDYFLHKGFQHKPRCFEGAYIGNPEGFWGFVDHNPVRADFSLNASGLTHQPCLICYKDFDPPWLLGLHIHEDCLQKGYSRQQDQASASGDAEDKCPSCDLAFRLPVGEDGARLKLKNGTCGDCDGCEKPLEKWCEKCKMLLCVTSCERIHSRLKSLTSSETSAETEDQSEHSDLRTELTRLMEQLDDDTDEQRKLSLLQKIRNWSPHIQLLQALNIGSTHGNMRELSHIITAVKTVKAVMLRSPDYDDTVIRILLCGLTETEEERRKGMYYDSDSE